MQENKYYFYIIESQENKRYCGCSIKKTSDPKNFMKEDGYQTSSNTIKDLIKTKGLSYFRIIYLKTFAVPAKAYRFETLYLRLHKISERKDWYNGHNNRLLMFCSEPYNDMMMKLYGVLHPMESEVIKNRLKNTNLSRHGFEWPTQDINVREKIKQTMIDRYGVEHNSQIPGMVERKEETYFNKTGYKYPGQNPESQLKSKRTKLEKYDDENYRNINKMKQTLLERYGVDSFAKTEEGKTFSSKSMTVCNKIEHYCKYCKRIIIGPNYNRWHGDYCKENTNRILKPAEEKIQCEFCHEYVFKRHYGQNHGNYCKENPNKLIRKNKPRLKINCITCGKDIDISNFDRHYKKCQWLALRGLQ